ncbi:MAG: hypothetical protein JW913_18310 [Chitinispirillaceae bacterium]|nr:hypothetical protein [Chitinispirillaceae bacterium]
MRHPFYRLPTLQYFFIHIDAARNPDGNDTVVLKGFYRYGTHNNNSTMRMLQVKHSVSPERRREV